MSFLRWLEMVFDFGSKPTLVAVLSVAHHDPTQPIGSRENPCTIDNSVAGDREGKFCLCSVCKIVGVQTPSSDYYGVDGKTLCCESCLAVKLENAGIKLIGFHEPPIQRR